jgi:hypothetical protein
MISVRQQMLQYRRFEQGISVDQDERGIHFVPGHPAGTQVVRQPEERIVKRSDLDALDLADDFVDGVMAEPGHDKDFIYAGYGQLCYLPLKYGHATRPQTAFGRYLGQRHQSPSLSCAQNYGFHIKNLFIAWVLAACRHRGLEFQGVILLGLR